MPVDSSDGRCLWHCPFKGAFCGGLILSPLSRYIDIEKNQQEGRLKNMSKDHSNIDHYEKQFGIIAIEKGFISPDMLVEALKIQIEEEVEFHTHRLIGEILLEKDYLTAMQIQEILNSIFKHRP
jgi:hypothetical protein